jgi:parallel beta-helix repeat protein
MRKIARRPANKTLLLLLHSSLLSFCLANLSLITWHSTAAANDTNPVTENSDRQPTDKLTLYVNPDTGNDGRGQGTLESPFKTITQALMLAKPTTTIILAVGTYSQETGEEFPLILKNNVTIQGNSKTIGKDIVIQGGGLYTSPTAAAQNATLVATKNAGKIIGVTIMNPNSRGHGLWIESANPEIQSNMFAGNGTSGLSINGNSKPIIDNNYFYQNRGNGLLVYGTSQPQIKNNIFDRTGFGISAVQNTLITVVNNRFYGNRIGIILEGNAQAILRNNAIEQSTEDGLVTIAKSRVDLGTLEQPGKNTFKNNAGSDIRNLTKTETIVAYGNQLNGKNQGAIDLNANMSNVNIAISTSPNITTDRSTPNILPSNQTISTTKNTTNNRTTERTIDNTNNTNTSSTNINNTNGREIVFSAPTDTTSTVPNNNIPQQTSNNHNTGTLPPPPIPTTTSRNNTTSTNNTPSNNNSNSNRKNLGDALDGLSGTQTSSHNNPVTTNNTGINGYGYRVIVSTRDNAQKEEVKSLYPDAFSTNYNGRSMLQIGVFSSRESAEQILQYFKERGLDGLILER